jgi:hypothetical protein
MWPQGSLRRPNMTEFRTVQKNGKKRVIPISGARKAGIRRKARAADIAGISSTRVDRIVRGMGFKYGEEDPFDLKGNSTDFSVNGMRLDGIDEVYLGEETVSFYRSGKQVSSIFYSDLREFHPGGKSRIGGN